MDKNQRAQNLNHLRYLAHIAMADSKADSKERQFYFYMADKLNIGKTVAQQVLDNPEDMHLMKPQFHDQRRGVLMDILTIMVVNKEIDEYEIELCRKFSQFLGFSEAIVEKVAAGLLDYSQGKLSKAEIEEIIDQL